MSVRKAIQDAWMFRITWEKACEMADEQDVTLAAKDATIAELLGAMGRCANELNEFARYTSGHPVSLYKARELIAKHKGEQE